MVAKRRNVKSIPKDSVGATANAHERQKNFLSPDEVGKLLETAKRGRHGIQIICCC